METDSSIADFTALVRGAGVVFLGTLTGKALALGGQVLVIQNLKPSYFGKLSLAYTIVAMSSTIAMFGLSNGVTRLSAAADGIDEKGKILNGGRLIGLASGTACAMMIIVFRDLLSNLFSIEFGVVMIVFSAYIPTFVVARVNLGGLRSTGHSLQTVFARDILPRGGSIVVFLILLNFFSSTVAGLFFWISISTLSLIASFVLVERTWRYQFTIPSVSKLKSLFKFSYPLALEAGILSLMSNTDIIMIGYFLNPGDVGKYQALRPISQVCLVILTSFSFLYLPLATKYFENSQNDNINELYQFVTKWSVLVALPGILILADKGRYILNVLYGSEYSSVSQVLAIMVIGIFGRFIVGPNGSTIKAIDRTRINLLSSSVGLVSNAVLNYLLIPEFGLVGAAVATAMSYLIYNSIEVAVVFRAISAHPFQPKLVLLAVMSVGAYLLIQGIWNFSNSIPVLIALGAIMYLIHGGLSVLLGVITREDREMLSLLTEKA